MSTACSGRLRLAAMSVCFILVAGRPGTNFFGLFGPPGQCHAEEEDPEAPSDRSASNCSLNGKFDDAYYAARHPRAFGRDGGRPGSRCAILGQRLEHWKSVGRNASWIACHQCCPGHADTLDADERLLFVCRGRRDYVPINFDQGSQQTFVEWAPIDNGNLTQAMYDWELVRYPSPVRITTGVGALIDLPYVAPGVLPSGFIFHMSRCGSSVPVQMLHALDRFVAVSESDIVWQMQYSQEPEDTIRYMLKLIILSLARPKGNRQYFFKFPVSSRAHMRRILEIFPQVPWIFVYRDPHEVMVSNVERPGEWMKTKYLQNETVRDSMSAEDWLASKISESVRAALENLGPNSLIVDYGRIKESMVGPVARLFQMNLTETEVARMLAVTRYHAKRPNSTFVPDGRRKKRRVTAPIANAVQRHFGTLGRIEAKA